MQYQHVYIEALETLTPPVEVTTASLEKMLSPLVRRIGLKPGVIEALTGVRARRLWSDGMRPSEAAAQVCRDLLQRHPAPPCGVQALVSTSVSKDYIEPPIASLVAGDLGVGEDCHNFDVGHACLGFVTGLTMVGNMIELGQIECGIVVAGEGSREVTQATIRRLSAPGVDFRQFAEELATLTLGSMAVAALVVHERHATKGHKVLGGVTKAATHHSRLCLGTRTEMRTDAATLLRAGVDLAEVTMGAVQRELEFDRSEIREFVLHQVGKANHDAIRDRFALPEERALRLYVDNGNVGAAGVPFTLATAAQQGRLRAGDKALLMGIGSGLNCAMMGVQW
ncbi:MAG: 3-oxoacyl-ACP synthase III [Myxococcota bacterium]